MSNFDSIVKKLLTEDSFATQLVGAPEETLRAHGVEPTAEIVNALRHLDPASLGRLASAFGQQQAAAA